MNSVNEGEPHARLMDYDERHAHVLTWYAVGSVEADNLRWRFITDEGRTVVVRPLQLARNAGGPLCVPSTINSALSAARFLILLAHEKIRVRGEPEEPDYDAIEAAVREKVDHTARSEWNGVRADLQKQAKTVDPTQWKDSFHRQLAEEALRSRPDVFANVDAAKKEELTGKYIASLARERYEEGLRIHIGKDLFAQQKEQNDGLLKRCEEEMARENLLAAQAIEAARTGYDKKRRTFPYREITLYEINAFIGRTTGKKPVEVSDPRKGGGYTAAQRSAIAERLTDPKDKGAETLESIRAFILHELFKDPAAATLIRDANLRRLVAFMGKQLGRDMALPVMLAYNSAMRENFKRWVAETAAVRKIKLADAQRFLTQHVAFIAECEGLHSPHYYPIEDIAKEPDVTDRDELESFTKAGGLWNRRITPQLEPKTQPATIEHKSALTAEVTEPRPA